MAGEPRPCKVCGCLFSHKNPRYTTCGSPRCRTHVRRMTQQNSSKRQAERLKQAKNREFRRGAVVISDEASRQRVATAYQRALDAGFIGLEAAREAAIKTGETVASVLSVWKSVKAR